jgi:hypothetical protein
MIKNQLRTWKNWITVKEYAQKYGLTNRRARQIMVELKDEGKIIKCFTVYEGIDKNLHCAPMYKVVEYARDSDL